MMGEEDGEDGLRRPQSTAEGGASGGAEPWAPSPRWRARNGEPKASHVSLWVAPGTPGGAPEAAVPAREQNQLTRFREGEVRVP